MRLKNRVREAREARGWSQNKLSQKSGISRPTLSSIENNEEHEPTFAVRQQLVNVLGDAHLFWLEGSEPAPLAEVS